MACAPAAEGTANVSKPSVNASVPSQRQNAPTCVRDFVIIISIPYAI
jgi:hypothetical protein